MPEQAVAGVLASASPHGDAIYLAVAFGLFTLVLVGLQQRWMTARDREHRDQLAEAHQLVRELNDARVKETGEILRCTRDGINGSVVAIRETTTASNTTLVNGFMRALEKLEPVIAHSNSVIARAERVMDGLAARPNGHG